MDGKKETKTTVRHKVLTIIGIVISVILLPMLIINITLIVKSYTNPDAVPSVGGFVPMIVLTDSMYPEIQSGDLIISKTTAADDVQVGDVITFFDPQSTEQAVVTHRVEEITDKDGTIAFVTKGDANNIADSEVVPAESLIGVYRFRIGGAGGIAMFMQTTQGLIICVICPLILLVGYDILRRRKYEKSTKRDADALLVELEALKLQKLQNNKTSQEGVGEDK